MQRLLAAQQEKVKLDIGGHHYSTARSTLTSTPGTVFDTILRYCIASVSCVTNAAARLRPMRMMEASSLTAMGAIFIIFWPFSETLFPLSPRQMCPSVKNFSVKQTSTRLYEIIALNDVA
jgi:hypothetical protein